MTCSADLAADERAIREMSQRYGYVQDIDAEMEEFTDDVWFYSPLRPDPTRGKAERRRAVEGRRAAAPGDSTIRLTTGVMVAACGDLAIEHGRFVTRWRTAAGPDSTVGYYLMTFRKEHGVWKIAAASVHRSAGTVPSIPARRDTP
jgi:ketosteroid isomerase-like protein